VIRGGYIVEMGLDPTQVNFRPALNEGPTQL